MFEALNRDDRAALDFLLEEEGVTAARPDFIARRPELQPRLSFAQRRLWFLHQLNPTSPAYNVPSAIRLQGPLDLGVLKASFKEIVRRHEVLRTTVCDAGEGPTPCLHDDLDVPLDLLELSMLPVAEREIRVRQYTAEQAAVPFNLVTGPLMRVGVARLSHRDHIAVLVMHHIVADAWSMGVLVHELSQLYAAFKAGLPMPLRELPIQYADYSSWQWEQRDSFQTQSEFWRENLRDLPLLDLPTDRPRRIQPSFAGAVYPLRVGAMLTARLKALGGEQHATLFMTLLAAFQIFLSRYTQHTDIPVGSPIAGRNRSELEPLIGFFTNSLVLRTRWSPGANFRQILREVRQVALQAYENQDVPFDEVVRAVLPGRDLSHNPLFQVMFSLETEIGGSLRLTEVTIVPEPVDISIAKFDLTLNFTSTPDGLWGGLEYSTDLFDQATIARMAGHFVQLLESIVRRPDTPVARLAMLSGEEHQRLVYDFNRTEAAMEASSIGRLFEEQAFARPEAVSVEFEGRAWSYAELNQTAAAWAGELLRRGIRLQDRVAICMEPSFEMVAATLATIQAGATYVPLNPSYPDQRIAFILRDTQARALLIQRDLRVRFAGVAPSVICLEPEIPPGACPVGGVPIRPDHLAYIIYTSGSTGVPKGIAVTHRAVIRLVRNTNYVNLRFDDRVALASNFAFDAVTFELWGALLNGASLVGLPREIALDPIRLARLLRERNVTTLFLTTALFNQIARHEPAAFQNLRYLMFGGEAVDVESVRGVLSAAPPARLLHVYGPTECTTFATWHEIARLGADEGTVPIGRPLSNTRAYVVDRHLELVPPGIPGELLLGGPGLSLGYVNRPELTAAAFVPDPFTGEAGGRLYRTGDFVRLRDSGELEFLGRIDDQVKIRGFRIEPAEISATLSRCPAVKESVVVVREDVKGDRRLIGYVVAAEGKKIAAGTLRAYLVEHLPEYLIPSVFVELPRLPLNANGKVDRNALPTPPDEAVRSDEAPRDEREQTIAQAWCKVLHRREVGIRQTYFELGGDSITAIQIVGFLRRNGWQIQVRDLFQHPTIEKLAACLQRAAGIAETRPLQLFAPLAPTQRWFLESHLGPVHHFNQSLLLKSRQELDPIRLQTALGALCERHDALRTVFRDYGAGFQQVLSDVRIDCPLVDLHGSDFGAVTMYADAVQRRFNLTRGPLLQAALLRCDDADRLLLIAHHLVIDGVSWRILLEELRLAYGQLIQGRSIDLGPRPTPWQHCASALQARATCEPVLCQLSYWGGIIKGAAAERFPSDGETKENNFGDMKLAAFQLTETETRDLLEKAGSAFHTEVNDLLLVALARALVSWGDVRSSVLTLEGHGRDGLGPAVDANSTIGWFTSVFPFRLECAGSGLREQIITVKEALRRVPDGGSGYGILRHLTPREFMGSQDLSYPASLSFNYLGQFDAGLSDQFWELAPESTGMQIAPDLGRQHDLDLTAIVLGGRLNVSLAFHPGRHHPERISRLLRHYQQELITVTRYCCGRTPEKTAVDFTCKDFSQAVWDDLRERNGWTSEVIEDVCPLSPMQEGLFFQAIYDGQARAYHLQMAFEVEGELNPSTLAYAWSELARRHAVLRTAFIQEGVERPVQLVLRERTHPLTIIDSLPEEDPTEVLQAVGAADLARGFDLAHEPLSRLTVVRVGPNRAHLVWSCHHLLLDGWSLGILWRELVEIYHAREMNVAPVLAPAPPYSQYLRWIQTRDRVASREYWANVLQDLSHVTTIPRPAELVTPESIGSTEIGAEFDAELTAKLRALATREEVTLNHLVQAVWSLLLVRYNGTREAIFGTIVSGRPTSLPDAERAVGLFINAIPVRIAVPPQMPFAKLAQSIRDRALEAEPHHYMPLAEIQARSELGRDLISHLLIFENYPVPTVALGDAVAPLLTIRPVYTHDETHYDFTLVVTPGDRLHLKLSYNPNAFSADQIARIATHVETAARALVEQPDCPVGEIEILPEAEHKKVTVQFNCTATPCDLAKTSSARIEENARLIPTAVAVHCGNESVSYRELGRRSNSVALSLQGCGVKPGDRVGVLLKRSPALIASLLGVWKVRAAYVPIDPDCPPERIGQILRDSRCPALLTDAQDPNRIALPTVCRLLRPEEDGFENAGPLRLSPTAQDIAYVIYTSGSTGVPKGCEITHRNLANYLQWICSHLHAEGDSGDYSLFTSVAFDLTVTSLFVPLLLGRTLHIFPQDEDLPDILRAAFAGVGGIDTVKCTPSHISLLKELGLTDSALRVCILGGEAVASQHVTYLHSLNAKMRICNEYGPTETTVGCIAANIAPGESRVSIGRPIANCQVYVLDRDRHPAPIGVPGEISIGGENVGQGYLYRPDLTAERFVPDPSRAGVRIYCTGDIGRWLPDGTMDYLGRNDDQVKIRGHRVELEEIQQAIAALPGVRAAVVLSHHGSGQAELVAYVVSSLDEQFLHRRCRENLPSYLVPARIIPLSRLPLTSNGKLDRGRLPDPKASRPSTGTETTQPRTPTESALMRIWAGVLGYSTIGIRDNFFDLGGHSLKAIQLLSRIHQQLGRKVALRDLFQFPTIEALARTVDGLSFEPCSRIEPVPPQETYELSYAQKRLWLADRLGASHSLNTPEAILYRGQVDVTALENALYALIDRHESLRTAFILVNGQPRQKICPPTVLHVRQIDLRGEINSEMRAREIIERDAMEPFNLTRPTPIRTALIRLSEDRGILLLTAHHIVGDGWSRRLFFAELAELYKAFVRGVRNPLEPLPLQYKDYAAWQNARSFSREQAYWMERLRDVPEAVMLPFDFSFGRTREFLGGAEKICFSAQLTEAVRSLARKHGTLVSYVMLTMFKLTLFHISRQSDLCIGLSCANRNHPQIERLIGFFVNVLPIRTRVSEEMDFADLLRQVVAAISQALEFQDYPLDLLIQKLNPPRRSNRPPLINVVYGFHDFPDLKSDLELVTGPADALGQSISDIVVESEWAFPHETAKFDLTLLITDNRTHLELLLEYDRALFIPESARNCLTILEKLTHAVTRPPSPDGQC